MLRGPGMLLTLRRQPSAQGATIGELLVDGRHECWTLEDVVRPLGQKVPGQTAIPAGRYPVVIAMSRRFARRMPLLLGVPGFRGVHIRPGNSSGETEGCILVGRRRAGVWIGQARPAFAALFRRLNTAFADGEIWIEIHDPPAGA